MDRDFTLTSFALRPAPLSEDADQMRCDSRREERRRTHWRRSAYNLDPGFFICGESVFEGFFIHGDVAKVFLKAL